MPSNRETLVRYICGLAASPPSEQVSDAALLDRFIAARDEQAFTALVERHGAMVLQVCRRILGNDDDAEDAFQGTFLVRRTTSAISSTPCSSSGRSEPTPGRPGGTKWMCVSVVTEPTSVIGPDSALAE
jgi:hypothetical protein